MSVAIGAETDLRPEFKVAVFGLAAKLQRVLEIVLKHARHNQYRYTVAASKGPGQYDIALVDMTVKGGPLVARTLKRLSIGRPVVTVGRRTDPIRRDDVVHCDFTMQVLSTLNGVVDHQLLGVLPPADRQAARTGQAARPARADLRTVAPSGFRNMPQPLSSAASTTATAHGAAPLLRSGLAPGAADGDVLTLDRSTILSDRPGGLVAAPRPRLLIVDDSPTVRRQLLEALVPMRLEVDAVACAAEALKALAVRRYDLIFVDVVMPDMDGYKLTRIIKREKRLRGIAIVMLTSRSSPFDLLRGALAGCNSYLVKPVSLASLKETVIRHTRRIAVLDEQTGQLRMAHG